MVAADHHAVPEGDIQAIAWRLRPGGQLILEAGA